MLSPTRTGKKPSKPRSDLKPSKDGFSALKTATSSSAGSTLVGAMGTAAQFTAKLAGLAGFIFAVQYVTTTVLSVGEGKAGADGIAVSANLTEINTITAAMLSAYAAFNATASVGEKGERGFNGTKGDTGTFDYSTIESPIINTPTITGTMVTDAIQSSSTVTAAVGFSGPSVTAGSSVMTTAGFAGSTLTVEHIRSPAGTLNIGDSENTEVLNVGAGSHVSVINYGTGTNKTIHNFGSSGDELNFAGNITWVSTQNVLVTNKVIVLNNGGAAGSSGGSGVCWEEAGDHTSYCMRQSGTRNSFELKSVVGPLITLNQDLQQTAAVTFASLATTGSISASGLLTASGGTATTTLTASGLLAANGGATTTTLTASGLLTASAGVSTTTATASGLITANAGLNVENAVLNANFGLVVPVGQTVAANGGATTTTLAASGLITANAGLTVENAVLTANFGLVVPVGKTVAANGGATTTTLTASGVVTASAGVTTTTLTASGLVSANGGFSTTTSAFSGLLAANGGVSTTSATASGLITANGGITTTSGITFSNGGATQMAHYQETTLSLSYTGARSVSTNCRFTRAGKMIAMTCQDGGSAACAASFFTSVAIPTEYIPWSNIWSPTIVINNGAKVMGLMQILTTGAIRIFPTLDDTSTFTATGACGWHETTATWTK